MPPSCLEKNSDLPGHARISARFANRERSGIPASERPLVLRQVSATPILSEWRFKLIKKLSKGIRSCVGPTWRLRSKGLVLIHSIVYFEGVASRRFFEPPSIRVEFAEGKICWRQKQGLGQLFETEIKDFRGLLKEFQVVKLRICWGCTHKF